MQAWVRDGLDSGGCHAVIGWPYGVAEQLGSDCLDGMQIEPFIDLPFSSVFPNRRHSRRFLTAFCRAVGPSPALQARDKCGKPGKLGGTKSGEALKFLKISACM